MPNTLLVVDDDLRLARAMLVRLRAAGFDVTHAIDGRAALDHALQTSPELVVLDIRLPDMSGFEVCRRLRELPQTRNTPIIFHSANSSQKEREHANAAGGNQFLAKPCSSTDLLAAIRHHLGSGDKSQSPPGDIHSPSVINSEAPGAPRAGRDPGPM